MISVVITCCERDKGFLERCRASVEWQLAEGDEVIAVGDGVCFCTNGFHFNGECKHDHSHKQSRVIAYGSSLGVSHARNVGWRAAKNDWIKFLDVDDLLAPFALSALRAAVIEVDIHQVLVGGQFVVHNGIFQGYRKPQSAFDIGAANPFLVSHSAIRRSALEAVGGFDERIAFEEDWDLWLRLHAKYGRAAFGFIGIPVCFYTIDDGRRAETERTRNHKVEGIDVREYLRRTYGIEATG